AGTTLSAEEHLLNNNAPQAQAVLDRYLTAHPTAPSEYGFRWVRRVVSGEDYHTQETGGATYALAASHDGRMFATGGEDGTVRLWRASDGVRLHEFEFPHTLSIYSLAFSPHDDLILSAGGDLKRSEVILWDVPAKIRRMDFAGPSVTANAVAFSPDGKLMAVAGSGRAGDSGNPVAEIRVWEIDLAQRSAPAASVKQWFSPPRVWQSATWNSANSLAFTADSQTLVVGYGFERKGAVGFWEVKSGKEDVVLPAAAPVWTVAFADQERRLVAGDLLGGVAAWSYPERKELGRVVMREDSKVMALTAAGEGTHVFAATTYSHEEKPRFDVTQWDVTSGPELVAALANAAGECRSLAALPDGVSLLSAGTDGPARRWNIQRHTLWTCLPEFPNIDDVVLSPEATHAAAIWDEGDFVIYRLSDGARRNLFSKHGHAVVAFGRSHEEVFTSGEDGIVKRHFLEHGSEPRFEVLTRHGRHPFRDDTGNQDSAVRELDYAPGPRRLASCGNDGRVQVWDLDEKRRLFETPDQGDRVRDVRFSRDGSLVAAAVANRWARVWRANSGELVHESKHSEELWSVAIAPDNLQLAVGGDQGTLWLHDLRTTGDEPRELLQGRGEVDSLDYSPDGRTLAAVDRTRTIRLWEPTSGAKLLQAPYIGGGSTVRLRFSRDGNMLVADVGARLVMWSAERAPPPSQPPASAAELRTAMSSASAMVTASPTAYAARVRRAWNRYVGDNLDNAESMLDEAGYALPSKVARPFEMGFLHRQSKREELWARGSGGSSEGTATSLALSEDARLGAIGTRTGHVTSMDPYSNRERRIYELGAPIVDLAVAPDRARLFVATAVSGTAPFTLKTLTLPDGKTEDLGGAWGQISAIATSPDGRWLVAGGWDGTDGEVRVRRFELRDGSREGSPLVIKSRSGDHESATPIWALAFSPDSRTLAVGHGNPAWRGSHGMVTFWDLESGTEASARFTGFGNFVQSLAFSPDGRTLAAGALDGTLRLWDVPGQRPIATLPAEGGPIQRVAFSRDGQFVATGSAFPEGAEKPGELLLWDVAQRTLASCLARFPRGIYGLAFHPDGEMLVVLTAERALRAIPYRKREVYQRIPAHEGAVQALEFDSSGRLFTAGRDRSIRSWDLESRSPQASLEIEESSPRGMALAADGKALLTFGERPELAWRDSKSGSVLRRSDALPQELLCVTMSADGAVAAADVAGGLHRWDAEGKLMLSWTTPLGPVRQLLFTDDLGRMAASACADKVVFWDTHSGNYRDVLDAGSEVRSLALSPDRKLVAAGTAQGAIRVWSVESGKLVAAIREHTAPVAALAFATDGQTLASAAGPGEICLWNVPTLEKLFPLNCPNVQVNMLRFSPDNRRLVAGLADGALVVWRASEEE
ncbi:MAG: WD40 repeat domain-containing protein, partial [Pirellulales bacterium]